MKVLMINGSPHKEGNTYNALKEMEKIFSGEGIESEIIQVGHKPIRGCIGCRVCAEKGYCVFDDCVNEIAPKFEACDGLVIGSPVYYASANGTMVSFLDRLFFSTSFDKTMKVGASVAVARRGMIFFNHAPFSEHRISRGRLVFGHLSHTLFPWRLRIIKHKSMRQRASDNGTDIWKHFFFVYQGRICNPFRNQSGKSLSIKMT